MPTSASLPQALTFDAGDLLRFGVPHAIRSGSVHYFRIHPDYWADRLARARAMGLNTIDTYIPWNFHQPHPTESDFTGWRDVERFIALAGDAGLDMLVRPGPYIGAEWTGGGLPSWVTAIPGVPPRTSDERFTGPAARWLDALLTRLAPLQATRGGPVVAVQVENEYGNYGDDHAYLTWLADYFRSSGITETLFTADGPTELLHDGGSIPGVWATAALSGQPGPAKTLLASKRDGEPFFCAEFFDGWFDHWGERHHVRSAESSSNALEEVLQLGSVSIAMAHGGTNFGLSAGANFDEFHLQPVITSYDADSPIAENGAIGDKFFAIRKALTAASGENFPEPPPVPPTLTERSLPVRRRRDLLSALAGVRPAQASTMPSTFEAAGLDSGLMLYRARPSLPEGKHMLEIPGLHDRARVFLDGADAGTIRRQGAADGLAIDGIGGPVDLELVVENMGRIEFGPKLGEHKGILQGVLIDRRFVMNWSMTPVPLDEISPGELGADRPPLDSVNLAHGAEAAGPAHAANGADAADAASAADAADAASAADAVESADAPGIATADLDIDQPADTFLALPGFGKGFVWVGDFLLGRYWHVGPQRTLYVPAPLLAAGSNRITVLELERMGETIELCADADLGPHEEFIETI